MHDLHINGKKALATAKNTRRLCVKKKTLAKSLIAMLPSNLYPFLIYCSR